MGLDTGFAQKRKEIWPFLWRGVNKVIWSFWEVVCNFFQDDIQDDTQDDI